jgi:hypothetical protein
MELWRQTKGTSRIRDGDLGIIEENGENYMRALLSDFEIVIR